MPSALVARVEGTAPESGPAPPRVVPDPSALRRVLLVKLSSLGDVVHALPLADALRAGLSPEAQIVWAVRDKFASLLRGNPNLSQVIELRERGAGGLMAFLRSVRSQPSGSGIFDTALDAQGLFLSGLITRASGAPVRIGMDRNREGNAAFLTHPIVPGRDRAHIVTKMLRYCDALGIPRLAPRPQRYLAEERQEAAAALLSEAGIDSDDAPCAGLIVGASTPEKAWPAAHWAALAGILKKQGIRPLLLGGAGEREAAAQIVEQARGAVAANLVGKTPLPLLASVMARCGVIVGGDSGPTHLAVGVGVPVVGLYGVTDPALTGPQWGAAPSVTLDYAAADAPPETRRPRHPTVADALARIPVAAAAEAAERLLRGE